MTQTSGELHCPYCGERRPHAAPGDYCVRILQERLADAESNLANERDTRRREPGLDTMIALFNAASRSAGQANEHYEICKRTLVELQVAYRQKLELLSDIVWDKVKAENDAAELYHALLSIYGIVPTGVNPDVAAILKICRRAIEKHQELMKPKEKHDAEQSDQETQNNPA